jgi:hypothetical protein
VGVVVNEFEVVPEERREASAQQPAQQQQKQTAAQRRHDVESTLRLIQSRADRLRAD